MSTRRGSNRRILAPLVAALALGLTFLIATPASAATPTLSTTFSPSSAGAGTATSFTLTASSNQGTLQSLSMAAPSGFYVNSASSSSGTAQVAGDNLTVNVTGLRISGSAVLTVTINASPECTPGSGTWNLSAVQKGGTAYVPQTFATSVTSSSSCFLSFGSIGSQVKSTAFSVSVAAKRANGTIDSTYTDGVSLTIEVDPGVDDATLTGGGSVTPVNGTATFNGVSLNQSGSAYVLEACSPTINGASCPATGLEDGLGYLSNTFSVFDSEADCSPSSCKNTGNGTDILSSTVTGKGTSGKVGVGIWKVPAGVSTLANLDCPGYDEISTDAVTFEYTGTGTKIVSDVISVDAMKLIADQGVSHLETCFGSSSSFTTKPGTPAATFDSTSGLWVGLLPDCPNKKNLDPYAPCNISRTGGGGGTGQIVYIAAAGDPAGRH